LIKLSERYVFQNADRLSTHNKALLNYCIRLGARIETSSITVPGVDHGRFVTSDPDFHLQAQLGIDPSDKVLLFMGTIFRFSGLFELISELAPTMHSDSKLKFLILGDGEDFERLKDRVEELSLQRQVIMPGRIEYEELSAFLRLGSVGLLPFRPELATDCALPAKVFQYLACGLPTVATQLEGLSHAVDEGDGIIFASSLYEMVSVALNLLENPQALSKLSKRGLQTISENYSWEKQIASFENILISTLP
jgi:glycosyltransferase involved in cell wall biosynthesis